MSEFYNQFFGISENERKIQYSAITTLQDIRRMDKKTNYEYCGEVVYMDLLERVSKRTGICKDRVRVSINDMIGFGIIKVTDGHGPYFSHILKLSDLA